MMRRGSERDTRIAPALLGLDPKASRPRPLPFDLAKAHELYKGLFGEVEDLIKDKHLLLVPSGALFDYLVGYLSKIKQRNATEFVPMSQVLGTADKYYGTYLAQFLFTAWGASVGLSEYYTPQNLNIFYAETAWTPKVSDSYGLKLSVQYTVTACCWQRVAH